MSYWRDARETKWQHLNWAENDRLFECRSRKVRSYDWASEEHSTITRRHGAPNAARINHCNGPSGRQRAPSAMLPPAGSSAVDGRMKRACRCRGPVSEALLVFGDIVADRRRSLCRYTVCYWRALVVWTTLWALVYALGLLQCITLDAVVCCCFRWSHDHCQTELILHRVGRATEDDLCTWVHNSIFKRECYILKDHASIVSEYKFDD